MSIASSLQQYTALYAPYGYALIKASANCNTPFDSTQHV